MSREAEAIRTGPGRRRPGCQWARVGVRVCTRMGHGIPALRPGLRLRARGPRAH